MRHELEQIPAIVRQVESLKDLEEQYRRKQAEIVQRDIRNLGAVKEAGDLVLRIRTKRTEEDAKVLGRGEGLQDKRDWDTYVMEELGVPQKTAWRQERIARGWPELEEEAERRGQAFTSTEEALRHLKELEAARGEAGLPVDDDEEDVTDDEEGGDGIDDDLDDEEEDSDTDEKPKKKKKGGGKTSTSTGSTSGQPSAPVRYVTLTDWNGLSDQKRDKLLATEGSTGFNTQGDNENIEWAQWSWNPVTGCLHDCPYCYARDIAERFYQQKFAPSLWPDRLQAPRVSKFPKKRIEAEPDDSWKRRGLGNVFVCSMADLFGRWVPAEWIEAVLKEVRAAAEWTFLFLTKFPIRMAEFDFPENAWVGTTVDCQARVKNAEKAFRKVRAGVKWLSCEPLIEPLKFSDLGAFQWLVLGGSSKSAKTPEWTPPLRWVVDLEEEAARCGVPFYEKSNLGAREQRVRQYPGDRPYTEPSQAPAALHYLAKVEGKES